MAPLQQARPHALAVPLPFQGHIQPLLALSIRLADAGFMVTFANTQSNHELMTRQRRDLESTAGALRFVSLEEESADESSGSLESLIAALRPAIRHAVARLLARFRKEELPVSLLVFDFRLTFMRDFALCAGVASLGLWTQNAANFASNLLYYWESLELPSEDSTLFRCARGVPPLKRKEVTGFWIDHVLPPHFPREEYGRAPFRRVHELTWTAINTFEELESTTLDTLEEKLGFRPLCLGPLVNAPAFSVYKEIGMNSSLVPWEWLQNHAESSVLYISFGTLVDLSELQLEELVIGLEASGQTFLWVFRANFCTSFGKHTIESLTHRFQHQGRLVPWAPQRDVLSHAAIGGFLTHCGWNSTIEAITIGVPMLAWPFFVDQLLNRRCVVEQWGIGLDLEVDDCEQAIVGRLEVEKKVRMLMQAEKGEELRQNAKQWSGVATHACKHEGSSWRHFNNLKDQLWSISRQEEIPNGDDDFADMCTAG